MNKDLIASLKSWLEIRPREKDRKFLSFEKEAMTVPGVQSVFISLGGKAKIAS
ncbi:hypothetical protein ACSS31_28180 (plasmid) [Priestia megaterium]